MKIGQVTDIRMPLDMPTYTFSSEDNIQHWFQQVRGPHWNRVGKYYRRSQGPTVAFTLEDHPYDSSAYEAYS